VLLGALVDPVALLAAPVGAGAVAAGYGMGVRYYRRRVEDVETALEAVLDDLERRPGPTS